MRPLWPVPEVGVLNSFHCTTCIGFGHFHGTPLYSTYSLQYVVENQSFTNLEFSAVTTVHFTIHVPRNSSSHGTPSVLENGSFSLERSSNMHASLRDKE